MEKITAKTVEDALEKGLKKLNKTIDEVEWEVIEEDSKGFLGLIGKKDAVIRIWSKDEKKESDFSKILNEANQESQYKNSELSDGTIIINEEPKQKEMIRKEIQEADFEFLNHKKMIAEETLTKIFNSMEIEVGLSGNVDSRGIHINIIVDEQNKGIVIGRRAKTLDAVQYITTLIINKDGNFTRLFLDVEGYREEREEILKSFAHKMANKALKSRRVVRLEPMNPYERRIIHSELQNFKGVYTYSEGNEPERYVVISRK